MTSLPEPSEGPSVLFLLGQILAEWRQPRKLVAGGLHISALADKIVGNGPAQAWIGNVMGGMGGDRQVAAGQVFVAWGACLDALELGLDGVVDGLIVANLEMQERVMLDGAPMAAVDR